MDDETSGVAWHSRYLRLGTVILRDETSHASAWSCRLAMHLILALGSSYRGFHLAFSTGWIWGRRVSRHWLSVFSSIIDGIEQHPVRRGGDRLQIAREMARRAQVGMTSSGTLVANVRLSFQPLRNPGWTIHLQR